MCPSSGSCRVLLNGARAIRTEPICLDMAVISALGQDHWRHTAAEPGLPPTVTVLPKRLVKTSATSVGQRDTASGLFWHGQECGCGHEGCGEKGEHGRGDGAGGIHGPPGSGDYSYHDEGGAKTSGEVLQTLKVSSMECMGWCRRLLFSLTSAWTCSASHRSRVAFFPKDHRSLELVVGSIFAVFPKGHRSLGLGGGSICRIWRDANLLHGHKRPEGGGVASQTLSAKSSVTAHFSKWVPARPASDLGVCAGNMPY